jgi:hypothetical protein
MTSLALLAFVKGEQTQTHAHHFAAGALLGLAAFVHESALICLVFYPLYALFIQRPTRAHAIAAAGIVAGISLDPIIYLVLTGDPLAHWRLLSGSVLDSGFYDAPEVGLSANWLIQPPLRLLSEQEFGLFPYFYLPFTVLALLRPSVPQQRLLAIWVAAILLWTYYGTVSPLSYVTLPRHPRFLSSITVPAVVLISHGLLQVRRRGFVVAAVAALCISGVLGAAFDGGKARSQPFRALHAYLTNHPPHALAVDRINFFPVLFYERCTPVFPMYQLRGPWNGSPMIALSGRVGTADQRVKLPSETLHVVTANAGAASDLVSAGARMVQSFPLPTTLYSRMLASPVVLGLLSLGRDEYRMKELRTPPEPLRLFQIDGNVPVLLTNLDAPPRPLGWRY